MRGGAEPIMLDPKIVKLRDLVKRQTENGDYAGAAATLSMLTGPPPAGFEWLTVESTFSSPVEELHWVVADMEIGPGRPCGIWGLGGSGKSWDAFEIERAVATGTHAFGHFPVRQGRVSHVSHELGARAVTERIRRLANGNNQSIEDFGDRFRTVCLPRLFLNSPGAEDAYCKAFEGDTLVVIDSLRRALPGEDENDSSMSNFLDILNRVSAKTGATFLVVHHCGKADHEDKRLAGRGSTAIMDGSGCIWMLEGNGKGPRKMTQIRPHDDGDGECRSFYVSMDRVAVPGAILETRKPPVRLEYQDETEVAETLIRAGIRKIDTKTKAAERVILDVVGKNPRISHRQLRDRIGDSRTNRTALDALIEDGRIGQEPGERGAFLLTVSVGADSLSDRSP